jgi:uncharacterized protein
MPANLTPEYHRAEDRYRAARTPEERIAALEEMLRVIPKHKGTGALQGDLRARLAKLRKQSGKKSARATHSHMIPREGAGQIGLVGMPNTGKSALVARLTRAEPEVADYPFTTREPTPGMMPFEDIAFQLVDLPPLSDAHVEPWVFDLIRRADLLWIVARIENALDELEGAVRLLAERKITVRPAGTLSDPVGFAPWEATPGLLVVTGMDRPGAVGSLEILRDLLAVPWPVAPVSATSGSGLHDLGRLCFEALGLMRIYTKQPGKPPDRSAPFALPLGATVADLALRIHKDLREQMKFARIWGPSAFDGQTVQGEHVLAEGDVVEIHA